MQGDDFDPYAPPRGGPVHDPTPDPEFACIDCGREAHNHRCGTCGFPLCGRHHETGGGFCTQHFSVGGVSVCLRHHDVSVGTYAREAIVLVTDGSADVYHLPDEYDEQASRAPACRPAEDSKVRVALAVAQDNDLDLCDHCATEARHRFALFKRDLRADLGGESGD